MLLGALRADPASTRQLVGQRAVAHPTLADLPAVPSTLRLVVDALSGRMKEQNPRFDAGRFEAAALPRQSERMKQAILKALERSGR